MRDGAVIAAGPGSAPFESVVPMAPAELTTMPSVALDYRIRAESIVWLTTVSADGRPHIVPIWFGWDGRTFLAFTNLGRKRPGTSAQIRR